MFGLPYKVTWMPVPGGQETKRLASTFSISSLAPVCGKASMQKPMACDSRSPKAPWSSAKSRVSSCQAT
jgi:hypothetical protein